MEHRMTESGCMSTHAPPAIVVLMTVRWVCMQPLGLPVVPDV